MKVLGDRVVVDPKPAEEMIGGIIIPSTAQDRNAEGTVKMVGPEVEGIEEGDQIIHSTYGGVELELDGETILVLRQSDVLIVK